MAKSQYPLDGLPGKAWKVTSPFGWRTHPISKEKKHHNGVDIWQAKEPSYLEACYDGKVVNVIVKNDKTSGGNQVVVQSVVAGKKVTWIYMHMVHGSIQVKKGQRISAGQVVGKMGETGFATGKHVHWEVWTGWRTVQPNINSGGVGFYDPMKFTAAAILAEKAVVEADLASPDVEAPVVVEKPVEAPKPAVAAPVAPVKVEKPKPVLREGAKNGFVKVLQGKLGVPVDGVFGPATKKAVVGFQVQHDLEATGIVDETFWKVIG